jgi:hypothetical protein
LNKFQQENYFWSDGMKDNNGKITLPKELQVRMLKFFLKTSVPRKKREKIRLLSEQKPDRSGEQ